jgi:hypothetical protein
LSLYWPVAENSFVNPRAIAVLLGETVTAFRTTPAGLTERVYKAACVCGVGDESLTWTLMLNVPEAEGVPES